MKKFALGLMAVSIVSLGACESLNGVGNKQAVGGVGGAVLGGLAGSQVGGGSGRLIATGVGVLVGGLLGSEIGSSLDKADMAYAQSANNQAHSAPLGQTVSWNNPDSGNRGAVTPLRDGYSSSGRYCREYEQTVYVDGRAETAVGTACQNQDGTWQILAS